MEKVYPAFTVTHIQNPNRLWAIPLVGLLIKLLILIPQMIMIFLITLVSAIMIMLINPFVVLFTGKYWTPAYSLYMGLIQLLTKVNLFFLGLSDTYPGFDLQPTDDYTLTMPMPSSPNRPFAIPVLGFVARVILGIPFFIFTSVIEYAQGIAFIIASFPVLFTGKYPESLYEIVRDATRVRITGYLYMVGLSDQYPSFWISMNHKNIKIALLIAGVMLMVMNMVNSATTKKSPNYVGNSQYNQQLVPSPSVKF